MISIDYTLIIVILNFIVLLAVLNKILYKPIKKYLEERKQTISEDLDEAKKSRENAEELVSKRGEELKSSAEEIRKLKQASRREAEHQASDILKEAKNQEKRILQDTEAQLEQEKVKTLKELEGELADMVSSLSEKFLSGKIDEEKDTQLIKNIIAERGDK